MSSVKSPVVLNILDKEYRIACPKGEEDSLQASAHLLNVRIQEIRDGGKVMGPDRMAVMAALNLAHDLLLQENRLEHSSRNISARIRSLQERIDSTLKHTRQLEL
ncbi:MAG: cell division protein ZapA [Gammaproteobacteria bacterium]|nr:cell division protein ZapA [Gammaproteobacteria bacterium]MDE0410589.1 cell division protein ZapA [Gammaproteobacteria bacterium]